MNSAFSAWVCTSFVASFRASDKSWGMLQRGGTEVNRGVEGRALSTVPSTAELLKGTPACLQDLKKRFQLLSGSSAETHVPI